MDNRIGKKMGHDSQSYTSPVVSAEVVNQEAIGRCQMNEPLKMTRPADYSDAVAELLGELWDKSESSSALEEKKLQRVVAKTFHWIQLLRLRALDIQVVAGDFCDRCRLDEPLLSQCGFFEEDRQTTILRVQRILSGSAQLIEKSLPSELRKAGKAAFRIAWENDTVIGSWNVALDEHVDVRTLFRDAAQMFGEYKGPLCILVADRILKDLRAGTLPSIPNFVRGASNVTTTILEWIQPGLELPESPPSENEPSAVPAVFPDEKELQLWTTHPELAHLFDRIICSGAVQNFQVPAGS